MDSLDPAANDPTTSPQGPLDPEKGVSGGVSRVETPPSEMTNEALKLDEIQTIAPTPITPGQPDSPPISSTPPAPTKPDDKVVDKTKEKTRLHKLATAHDKLTTVADMEEEEFITEVEAAHGHK